MRFLKFREITLPESDGDHSFSVVARDATVTMPYGVFDQDSGRVVLQPAKLSYRALITSDVDDTLDRLKREVGKQGILQAIDHQGRVRVIPAKLLSIEHSAIAKTWVAQVPVTVSFKALWTYWTPLEDGLWSGMGYLSGTGLVSGGFFEAITLSALPQTYTINNNGVAPVLPGTLLVVPAAASSVVNLRVENIASLMSFGYIGTLNAGDRLELDFLSKRVRVNDVDAYGKFTLPDKQMDWMRLDVGVNPIVFSGASIAGTASIKWNWRRQYL